MRRALPGGQRADARPGQEGAERPSRTHPAKKQKTYLGMVEVGQLHRLKA